MLVVADIRHSGFIFGWLGRAWLLAVMAVAGCGMCKDSEEKTWWGPAGRSVHVIKRDCGATTQPAFHFEHRSKRWLGASSIKLAVAECPYECDPTMFDVEWVEPERLLITIPSYARIFDKQGGKVEGGYMYEVLSK